MALLCCIFCIATCAFVETWAATGRNKRFLTNGLMMGNKQRKINGANQHIGAAPFEKRGN